MDVVVDGRVVDERALHRALGAALDLGPHDGHNLAALWDRLTTDVLRPVHLVWEHHAVSRQRLGDDVVDRVVALLDDVVRYDAEAGWEHRFTYVLA